MKCSLLTILGLFLLVGLLSGLLTMRWQIVPAGNFTVYRLDRFSGRVEVSVSGGKWSRIESRKFNEWGDEEVDW